MHEHLKTLIDIGCYGLIGLSIIMVLLYLIYDRVGHTKEAIERQERELCDWLKTVAKHINKK